MDGDGGLSQPFSILFILMKSGFNIALKLTEKKLYLQVFTLGFILVFHKFLGGSLE